MPIPTERTLSGGGPQGSTIGLLEYLSQSNTNTEGIPDRMKYKWLDDLTILEVVNLLTVGISSYNIKEHVPSDINTSNLYIEPRNLQTQQYINSISDWTEKMKMKLNHKKSSIMVFNFTEKYQFSSRLSMEETRLEFVQQCKLLGVIITSDLRWDENTKYLVKKANSRMELLRKLKCYNPPYSDLVNIYCLYIRSILEQSCTIWHSSLTQENITDLERIQKNALRNILQDKYIDYESALHTLKLETLENRRKKLMIKYSKQCLKIDQTKHLFPLNKTSHCMQIRKRNKYEINKTNTERYRKSTVPYIQRLLNEEQNMNL